jgi:hypothetical protein
LVNQSLKRKAIGWLKHTGSWIFQQMNWSVLSNELIRYFINTSIATTVKIGRLIGSSLLTSLIQSWYKVKRHESMKSHNFLLGTI